jgi:radical SAM superfamily enzyme YgiQ (UPF0313 family)
MKMDPEKMINALFMSVPYPGEEKFEGQPTGLLYALSVLTERKLKKYGDRNAVKNELEVWCPSGIPNRNDGIPDRESEMFFEKELTDYLKNKKPKIVGLSTFSISYQNAIKIRNLVKKISPKTIVLLGGANEDNSVKYYREKGKVDADFVFAGDAPLLLNELYKVIEENSTATVEEIKKIVINQKEKFGQLNGAGLILFNTEAGLKEIASQSYIEDSKERESIRLDKLPIMPRFLLKDEDEVSRLFDIFSYGSSGNKKTAQVMIGQGCHYGCGFCSEGIKKVWYDKDGPRSINSVRDLSHVEREFQELKEQEYEAIFFDDSTFFAKSNQYMKELIKLIKKYEFEWGCQTTLGSIHYMKDLLPQMRKSGLSYVYIGLEHFDEKIRDSFGKDIGGGNKFDDYSIEDTLALLKQNRIRVGISLTFGHPHPFSPTEETIETKKTAKYVMDRTAELIKRFRNIVGVSLNLVSYHPGTPNSERYENKVGSIDYTATPNKMEPYTVFEEGIGLHAKGMTDELASFILSYAKEKLGDMLF